MLSQGQQLLEEGRFQDALAQFDGEDFPARFGRAVTLQLLGRLDEAEDAYALLLASNPQHEETLANLISLSVERFDLEGVERYSRRLLAVAPESQIALRGLLVVAAERRDFNVAASCFAKLGPAEEACRDTVEYRLSRGTVDRLREYGPVTHPY